MAKTELKLKSKNVATGQDITTTLSYVNSTADSATLKTFGQKLNALTTNNYVETDRVQTINVDTESVPTPAPEAVTLTLNKTQYNLSGTQLIIPSSDFTYTGTGNFINAFGTIKPTNTTEVKGIRTINQTSETQALVVDGASAGNYTLKICVPGTTAYDTAYTQATITIS